jgi:hypothetical protein
MRPSGRDGPKMGSRHCEGTQQPKDPGMGEGTAETFLPQGRTLLAWTQVRPDRSGRRRWHASAESDPYGIGTSAKLQVTCMMGDKRGYNEGLATPPGAGHRLRALRQGGRESLKLNTGDLQDIPPLRPRNIAPMNRSIRGSSPAVLC